MDATRRRRDHRAREGSGDERRVTVHRSSPDRTVFIEAENSDGWISTDLTVALER